MRRRYQSTAIKSAPDVAVVTEPSATGESPAILTSQTAQVQYVPVITNGTATAALNALPSDPVKAALDKLMELFDDAQTEKAGRRNAGRDQERLDSIHENLVALGANCPNKTKSVKQAEADGDGAADQAEELGVPLDVMVESVRQAFYALRTQYRKQQAIAQGKSPDSYWDWDDTMCPCCEAVYDGYAIAKVGLTFYKVPFTVTASGVQLPEQSTWEQVTQEWVTKSAELLALLGQNARSRETGAVKLLGQNRLGNYLMVWGDERHRDLYGEFFTKNTQGLKAIYDHLGGKLPALYQHAMDGAVKYTPVGTIDVLEIDEVGLWMETQLDMANEYVSAVQELARRKALGASSGALPGSRKVLANGEIVQWAIIEGSFTPTPAEPRLRELGVDVVKAIYAECGFEFPDESIVKGTGGEEPRLSDEAEREAEHLRLLELALH